MPKHVMDEESLERMRGVIAKSKINKSKSKSTIASTKSIVQQLRRQIREFYAQRNELGLDEAEEVLLKKSEKFLSELTP